MQKTIKQIADELNIDKQKVYRFIKKNHINETHQKNGVMYYDEAVETLILSHFSKNTASSEALQTTSNEAVIDALLKQSEALQNELDIKNKQIETLSKSLEESLRVLDQQQRLHSIAEQKLMMLEHKEAEVNDQAEEIKQLKAELDQEKRKGFLARLFSR